MKLHFEMPEKDMLTYSSCCSNRRSFFVSVADCRAGSKEPSCGDLQRSGMGRSRWPYVLCAEYLRFVFRRAATYGYKILKGANPAQLPVEQPTKFEFVVNLKAAKQIGLTIPPNAAGAADRVIK